ncbi:MAG: hypothetical protein HKP53_05455 [Eudoraea sp.]|nr:hypothetical protein [Eudoraea sp.]
MKAKNKITGIVLLSGFLFLVSCGPVLISSRIGPPPSWFYPNRVEVVRYVYFPEYGFYYDFTTRNYIYWDNSAWIRVSVLPPRYRNVNLNRSRYTRIRNYRDDNIQRYHEQNNTNRRRSNRTTTPNKRGN